MMNRDRIEGQQEQQSGKDDLHFEKMMNNKMSTFMGKYDSLVEILQKKYGNVKKGTVQRVDALRNIVEQLRNPMGS